MKVVSPARRKASRAGWQTALSTQSVVASDGKRSATDRWHWDCPVPSPTSSANSPKRNCDCDREHADMEDKHGRWMYVSAGAVSIEWTAAYRSCVPLPLVSARDWNGLRAQCLVRSRSRHTSRGRTRNRGHAFAEPKGPTHCPLPLLSCERLEQLSPSWTRRALRPGWNTRRASPSTARHPYLHVFEAAVAHAATGRKGGGRVL